MWRGQERLWWETGELEEGLVDYGFVFVLLIAADVAVCGEGFGQGEFEGVDCGPVPRCFDGHSTVIVDLSRQWGIGGGGRGEDLVSSEWRDDDEVAYSLFDYVDIAGEAFEIVY